MKYLGFDVCFNKLPSTISSCLICELIKDIVDKLKVIVDWQNLRQVEKNIDIVNMGNIKNKKIT